MPDLPILNVKNIHKRFGELEVLHGMSLEARSGDVISLIGSSGSGKSTFLRCINLLETPDQGEIELDGDAICFTTNRAGERVIQDEKQVQNLRAGDRIIVTTVDQQIKNAFAHAVRCRAQMRCRITLADRGKCRAPEFSTDDAHIRLPFIQLYHFLARPI